MCMEDNWSLSSANIRSLPQELLLIIFSFLTPSELCDTVSQVCVQWNEVHLDPSLYRALTFRNETTKNIIKFIKFARPQLESLTLFHNDFHAILEEVSKGCSQLRSLCLVMEKEVWYRYEFKDLPSVMRIIRKCPEIRTLKLKGPDIHQLLFYKHLSPMLYHLQTVHFVGLAHFRTKTVTDFVIYSPHLKNIKVYNNFAPTHGIASLSDSELIFVCEHLSGTLRTLHVNSEWSPLGLYSLKQCHLLYDLGIYQKKGLSSESLFVIGSMANLRKLQIEYSEELPEDDWIDLLTSPEMKNLESLSLEYFGHLNKVAETVGANLSKLTSLALLSKPAYDYEAKDQLIFCPGIGSILRGCRMLEILDLSCVDYASLSVFLHLIHLYLPKLKRICYSIVGRENKVKNVLAIPIWLTELTEKIPDLKFN